MAGHQMWRCAEGHRDLGDALLHPLARAEIERHAVPAPVVDVQPNGGIRRRRRARIDVLLLDVAADQLSVDRTGAVLRAYRVPGDRLRVEPPHRLEHLY